jgi:lipopolysaccharide transport system ATP-binding protein
MYLRLAFAVAAHLTAEILLVDEVLAVGDAAFQKKCLGKMGQVAHEGRTVIFVSHNMAAIRSLCSHGVVLEHGRVTFQGEVERALFFYTQSLVQSDGEDSHSTFSGIRINGQNPGQVVSGEKFEIACTVHVRSEMAGFRLFCIMEDANGEAAIVAPVSHRELPMAEPGAHEIRVCFPALWFRPGVYSVHFKLLVNAAASNTARFLSESVMVDVAGTDDPEMLLGYLAPQATWYADRAASVTR